MKYELEAKIKVENCPDAAANGWFVRDGEFNGRPLWRHMEDPAWTVGMWSDGDWSLMSQGSEHGSKGWKYYTTMNKYGGEPPDEWSAHGAVIKLDLSQPREETHWSLVKDGESHPIHQTVNPAIRLVHPAAKPMAQPAPQPAAQPAAPVEPRPQRAAAETPAAPQAPRPAEAQPVEQILPRRAEQVVAEEPIEQQPAVQEAVQPAAQPLQQKEQQGVDQVDPRHALTPSGRLVPPPAEQPVAEPAVSRLCVQLRSPEAKVRDALMARLGALSVANALRCLAKTKS
jgi:hypothetical protein